MGEVKTIYFRKGRRWIRAGLLCLNCLLFIPDPNFTLPTPTFPMNRKNIKRDFSQMRAISP
jgi:hypothetical protein